LTKMKPSARRIWNKITREEAERVLAIACLHPELSSRLLAVKIMNEEPFYVLESTVCRILKEHGLSAPVPLPEMPAQKQWGHKTTGPDELLTPDGTKGK
jgi:hypothetical protein